MKKPIEERQAVLLSFLAGEISKEVAATLLGCTKRTIEIYRNVYKEKGREGLIDHRHSNYHKLSEEQRDKVVALKQKDRWRSGRNIRDKLKLSVHRKTINNIFRAEGLAKENTKRVKAIQRFEAESPNDLWQTDIMGKIAFKNLGILYLIATLDDHSRFVPAGKWYRTQGKMNVFQIWYESLSRRSRPNPAEQRHAAQFHQQRRRVLRYIGYGAGGLTITAVGAEYAGVIDLIENWPQEPFSGEIEETKAFINQWSQEVGQDGKRLEQYFPRILSLATAYYSYQMTRFFPDTADQYDRKKFKDVFAVVDRKEFFEKFAYCNGRIDALRNSDNPAFGNKFLKKMYLNREAIVTSRIKEKVKDAFYLVLHELLHFSSKDIDHSTPKILPIFDRAIVAQKGLLCFSTQEGSYPGIGKECLPTYPYTTNMEEIVVESGALLLSSQVGYIASREDESYYAEGVRKYTEVIVNQFYNGSILAPLRYQQASDFPGLLTDIARRAGVDPNRRVMEEGLRRTLPIFQK